MYKKNQYHYFLPVHEHITITDEPFKTQLYNTMRGLGKAERKNMTNKICAIWNANSSQPHQHPYKSLNDTIQLTSDIAAILKLQPSSTSSTTILKISKSQEFKRKMTTIWSVFNHKFFDL